MKTLLTDKTLDELVEIVESLGEKKFRAKQIQTDLVLGKDNAYTEVYDPRRSMLHTQLLVNMAESGMNLVMPTKKRCPHMGCGLKRNKQEHTWDCPCHGSRFDKDGGVIEGPAMGDLK